MYTKKWQGIYWGNPLLIGTLYSSTDSEVIAAQYEKVSRGLIFPHTGLYPRRRIRLLPSFSSSVPASAAAAGRGSTTPLLAVDDEAGSHPTLSRTFFPIQAEECGTR